MKNTFLPLILPLLVFFHDAHSQNSSTSAINVLVSGSYFPNAASWTKPNVKLSFEKQLGGDQNELLKKDFEAGIFVLFHFVKAPEGIYWSYVILETNLYLNFDRAPDLLDNFKIGIGCSYAFRSMTLFEGRMSDDFQIKPGLNLIESYKINLGKHFLIQLSNENRFILDDKPIYSLGGGIGWQW